MREGVFAFLLAAYGVGKPGAVAFAWLAYASVALQAVLGGALYAAGRRRDGDAAGWTIDAVRSLARRRSGAERGVEAEEEKVA
ncbi:MAG: hypothetical protein LOY04_12425 [Rhodococcus ruber]|nr:hypothetical protein [Rhodococcus ruber]